MEKHRRLAAEAGVRGHRFTGACGITNFWGTVWLNGFVLLTTILRAKVQEQPLPAQTHLDRGLRHPDANASLPILHPEDRCDAVSVASFDRGMALLRLMLHDLQQTALATDARRELEHAQQSLHCHDVEEARLRKELAHRLHIPADSPAHADVASRGARAVGEMVDHLHRHYGEAVHLKGLAAELGMNAAYLSDLFSRLTGLTFHDYLNELRLSKAKELLGDPLKSVKEVASAVGYPDPNTFRQAFKSRTGLPPSAWRISG